MSTASVPAVPHQHAEVIKAWADGHEIQWRSFISNNEWHDVKDGDQPNFFRSAEWRIKPVKVYPVTQMGPSEMFDIYASHLRKKYGYNSVTAESSGLAEVANGALRHAIDAGQVVTMDDHQTALITLDDNLRGIEITRHATRDMAIAKAVREKCREIARGNGASQTEEDISLTDLAAIIAKVTPC